MASNKKFSLFNTGSSSILVLFISIALTTFSTLSMVSANNDYKLAEKSAEATTMYYTADTKAQHLLSFIDTAIQQNINSEPEEYLENVYSDLIINNNIYVDKKNNSLEIFFNIHINATQNLEVSVTVPEYEKDNERYIVNYWKTVTQQNETEEKPLNVWSGNKEYDRHKTTFN